MGWINGRARPNDGQDIPGADVFVPGSRGASAGTPAPQFTAAASNTAAHHTNGNNGNAPQFGRGFHKAVKSGAKGRVALVGVSGSGKSWTMLTLARALAGPTGKIAAIDTEHGSLSKYAGEIIDGKVMEFDVDEPDSYSQDYLMEQLDYAEVNGYDVFCVDSLSHFWMGKDGAQEFVDSLSRRTHDEFEGWKQFKPHERKMVDRFLASPCHIIVTMR